MKLTAFLLFVFLFASPGTFAEPVADRYQSLFEQAQSEQAAGNTKGAVKLYRRVYSKSVALKQLAFSKLIENLKSQKEWDEAIDLLKEEISENPFKMDNRISLCQVLFSAGKYKDALIEVAYAEKIVVDDPAILRIKGYSLQNIGNHADAIIAFTALLEKAPKSYDILTARAHSFVETGSPQLGFDDLQKALTLRPFDEEILSSLARVSVILSKHKEAKRVGQICVEQYPDNISCHESLGQAFMATKDYSKSIEHFEEAVRIDPRQIKDRLQLATALALDGKPQKSDSEFTHIFKIDQSYEDAMRAWVAFLSQRKDIEMLGSQLRSFSSACPANLWANVELAKLLINIGATNEALSRLKVTAKKSGSDLAWLHYAQFLDQAGQYSDALDAVGDIKDGKLAKDYYSGNLLYKQQKFEKAISKWSKVQAQSPHFFQARVNIGLALEALGQFAKSIEVLAKIEAPAEWRERIEKKIATLETQQQRTPATSESSVATTATGDDLKPFLDWELPRL
ncbi:MAG: tetratricopeptide repeat protein [Bdellovibrionaceae bacterium]|nr:tetratricopeptide repeat protein [Pseudobdellovibrionaceae bacterium]